jgi:hypothetical protein
MYYFHSTSVYSNFAAFVIEKSFEITFGLLKGTQYRRNKQRNGVQRQETNLFGRK